MNWQSKDGLTKRQMQVLKRIGDGYSSKEIAAVLGITYRTVEAYRESLHRTFNTSTPAQLTRLAIAFGMSKL